MAKGLSFCRPVVMCEVGELLITPPGFLFLTYSSSGGETQGMELAGQCSTTELTPAPPSWFYSHYKETRKFSSDSFLPSWEVLDAIGARRPGT